MQRNLGINFIVGFAIAILVMMVPGINFTPAAYATLSGIIETSSQSHSQKQTNALMRLQSFGVTDKEI